MRELEEGVALGEWHTNPGLKEWIKKLSPLLSNTDANGDLIDETAHGSGHAADSVSESTAAFIVCSVILLGLSTLYLAIRVYAWDKGLSKDWIRAHGDNRPKKQSEEEEKEANYKVDDSDDSEREAPNTDS